MNPKNPIVVFLYKALSLGLLLFFVIPPVLKATHAFEFHTAQKECKHSTTHLHSKASHNDVLDIYFQIAAETALEPYELKDLMFYMESAQGYQSSLFNANFHFSSTRGPPSV